MLNRIEIDLDSYRLSRLSVIYALFTFVIASLTYTVFLLKFSTFFYGVKLTAKIHVSYYPLTCWAIRTELWIFRLENTTLSTNIFRRSVNGSLLISFSKKKKRLQQISPMKFTKNVYFEFIRYVIIQLNRVLIASWNRILLLIVSYLLYLQCTIRIRVSRRFQIKSRIYTGRLCA